MIPTAVVFVYLAIVLYVGVFAFRRTSATAEDYFLAGRSLGPFVFLLSLFGTNMTAFAILGSSGLAYQRGVGVYGLMAACSSFVIPFTLFLIGTRLWVHGKRFGHMTQVQFFRDRWECSAIGTAIFALTATMLVPYVLIGVMGGGTTLEALSTVIGADGKPVLAEVVRAGQTVLEPVHRVSYEIGGGIVALVVMSYVFLGGMRGTAWVNTLQTLLFLCFGAVALVLISRSVGGFGDVMSHLAANPRTASLLTRQRIPSAEFLSYFFIPLSSIMFPHISILCLTAKRVSAFKRTVVLYPICILLIWLPSVYLGVVAADLFPGLTPGESDDVILRMLTSHTGPWIAGILGAAIMACVMASDSQILALSTMFTEDVFAYYGGRRRFGVVAEVWTGRAFVVGVAMVAWLLAVRLKDQVGIFDLAVRFAFSGYAALSPLMLAALFWKRSTKWGALAAVVWVATAMGLIWYLHDFSTPLAPPPGRPAVAIFPSLGNLFLRTPGSVTVYGFLPVLPMVLISALLMWGVSLLTPPPSTATIRRFFPATNHTPRER